MNPPNDLFNLLPGIVKNLMSPFRGILEPVLEAIWQNGYSQAQLDEQNYWAEEKRKVLDLTPLHLLGKDDGR